jgi:hypothetical protein
MFWTENVDQILIDGTLESTAPTVIANLERQARSILGEDTENDSIRWYIFLTHQATQQFLKPLLIREFGSVDEAKLPTLAWLKNVGSLETIARSCRGGDIETAKAPAASPRIPPWYTQYMRSSRWDDVKRQAEMLWKQQIFTDGQIRCMFNDRHEFNDWHHSDYALVGSGQEFRVLRPVCRTCHNRGRYFGPAVPWRMPEAVKQWITGEEAA